MEEEDVLGDFIESESSSTKISSFSSRTSSSSRPTYASNYKSNYSSKKPMCQYGAKCYRKNPEHLREFDHPKPGRGKTGWSNSPRHQGGEGGGRPLRRSNSFGNSGSSSGYQGASDFSAGRTPDINPCRNWVRGFCRYEILNF